MRVEYRRKGNGKYRKFEAGHVVINDDKLRMYDRYGYGFVLSVELQLADVDYLSIVEGSIEAGEGETA